MLSNLKHLKHFKFKVFFVRSFNIFVLSIALRCVTKESVYVVQQIRSSRPTHDTFLQISDQVEDNAGFGGERGRGGGRHGE